MRKGQCIVEGCGGTRIKAYGLCIRCYQRWRRGLIDDSIIVRKPKICTVDGCDNEVVARGYCNTHYLRWSKGATAEEMVQPVKITKGQAQKNCRASGCDRIVGRHGGKGLCAKHYRQWNRKRIWDRIIAQKGGKCQRCGGVFPYTVYDLHHRDPGTKDFGISRDLTNANLESVLKEAEKCDLLCANCHRLEHFGDGAGLPDW